MEETIDDVDNPVKTSSATRPDLDWSQVQETVMMLNLAVAQINKAMNEGNESVGSLTDSFTSMAGSAAIVAEAATALPEGESRQAIESNSEIISAQMQTAIMAFQFYDKLSQRLVHVCHSLGSLSELVGDKARLFSPYEWRGLQKKIRSKYPTEVDKLMFDAVLSGATIDEALAVSCETYDQEDADDDIELF